jgi:hypothetical protein
MWNVNNAGPRCWLAKMSISMREVAEAHRVGVSEGAQEVDLLAVDGGEGQVRMIAAHAHRDHLASSHHGVD